MRVVGRALRDVELGVREGRDVVRKTRGGLLKCRYNEFLHLQPAKLHGQATTSRLAPRPAAPLVPPAFSPQEEDRMRQDRQRLKAELQQRLGRGSQ